MRDKVIFLVIGAVVSVLFWIFRVELYEALYTVYQKHFPIKTLFVHLPYITEQEKSPSMDKVVLAEGIAEIIKVIGNGQCQTI